jgi:branched-chain amino acid transport system ATP-binding protein
MNAAGPPAFEARALSKRFGALQVSDQVSLQLFKGEIHALIGPNGAGKSTLIHQLSGVLAPDSGSVWLNGQDITRVAAHKRSAHGLARSYQITSVLARNTVLENLQLACIAGRLARGSVFSAWLSRAASAQARQDALALANEWDLRELANSIAGLLPHSEQRKLELALTVAGKPSVVLLDEPLAGMSANESAVMVEHIRALRQDHALLLVEHDMDAVFSLADRISVLVAGRIIASGAPAAIRNDAAVQNAYLGHAVGHEAVAE